MGRQGGLDYGGMYHAWGIDGVSGNQAKGKPHGRHDDHHGTDMRYLSCVVIALPSSVTELGGLQHDMLHGQENTRAWDGQRQGSR